MKFSFSFFIFVFFCNLQSAIAEDEGQNLPGQIQENSIYEEKLKEVEGDSSFMEGGAKEIDLSKYPLPEKKLLDDPNYQGKKNSKDAGFAIPSTDGKLNANSQVLEYSNREVVNEISSDGEGIFSFGYILNDYKYSDPRNVYNKTYKQSTGAQESGSLHLSMDKILMRSFVEFQLGANLGFRFAQGKGMFTGRQTESNAEFTLWQIPVDLSIGSAIPLSSWFKIGGAAGPSVMALLQTRSDKKTAEKHKRRRQIGPGYFFEGYFSFSLSHLIPSLGRHLMGEYNITQYYLTAIMRMQNYSNFQDDFTISGSSLGFLMTFEYF